MYTIKDSKQATIELGRLLCSIEDLEEFTEFYIRSTKNGVNMPDGFVVSNGVIYKTYRIQEIPRHNYKFTIKNLIRSLTSDKRLTEKLNRRVLAICEYLFSGIKEKCDVQELDDLNIKFNRISFTRFIGNFLLKSFKSNSLRKSKYNYILDELSSKDLIVFSCLLLDREYESTRFSEKILIDSLTQIYLKIPNQEFKDSLDKYLDILYTYDDDIYLKFKLEKLIGNELIRCIKNIQLPVEFTEMATTGYCNSIRLLKLYVNIRGDLSEVA